ncbi:MAG: DsbA family oxidoreductase [Nitrospinae bacterium]|nr:DsbA family oxidoreductase [Nitrospinota bacterium]
MITVEIWSDFVCPFCYIGKRRFEAALERFPQKDDVHVVWKSFQLDPRANHAAGTGVVDVLAAKYGRPREWALEMTGQVTRMAAGDGLIYSMEGAIPANTFDAHRLSHLAAKSQLQGKAEELIFAAYFTEGKNIGDTETLLELARGIGLDGGETARLLAGDAFTDEVRKDENEATRLGIAAVPCFVVNRAQTITGAQPVERLLDALKNAAKEPSTVR